MNKFTVHYPNGIKRHIDKHELAILSSTLQQIGRNEYTSNSLQMNIHELNGPIYLEGLFTFEIHNKRSVERMETPRGLVKRLNQMGFQ